MNAGIVYVLELSRPLAGRAKYYIGFAQDERCFFKRIKQHVKGQGAAFTRAAVAEGIPFRVVLILPNCTRADERRFKNWKKARQLVEVMRRRGFGASL